MDSPSPDTTGHSKDIFSDPAEDIFSDPLSDINSEPKKNTDVKIPSPASDEAVDLFSDPLDDDEPSEMSSPEVQNPVPDLLNEPAEAPKSDNKKPIFEHPAKVKKAASSELFDDDDEDGEDLFQEPFKPVMKKPQASVPPLDVYTEVKVKPQVKDDPTDLFTEEALTPPASKPATNTRTNGVHSEEQDLFSGTAQFT